MAIVIIHEHGTQLYTKEEQLKEFCDLSCMSKGIHRCKDLCQSIPKGSWLPAILLKGHLLTGFSVPSIFNTPAQRVQRPSLPLPASAWPLLSLLVVNNCSVRSGSVAVCLAVAVNNCSTI